MTFLIDKAVLMILSLLMIIINKNGAENIVAFLFGLVFTCINILLDEDEEMNFKFDRRKCLGMSICAYAVACLFVPGLVFVVPVILYDVFASTMYVQGVLIIAVTIYELVILHTDPFWIVFLAVISIFAILLQNKSMHLINLDRTVRRIRDDSEERNILLAEKNKNLIEKQDQDIYVATLKERNRIAREIHDNVGHIITRTLLQVGALMAINKEEPLHSQLSGVRDNLDIAMNNIRESVHDLHDESIDMENAVRDIVSGLPDTFICKLDYDISKEIDKKYKYAIVGIVKEAVSNIIKYSRNDMVDIILREHPAMYQVVIHDYSNIVNKTENICFEYDGAGIGLKNMKDRVESLKGNINFSSDNGFKVFVTLPKPLN